MTGDPTARFGAALSAVFQELDWPRLGQLACEGDGESFYDEESREALLDAGLRLAGDLGEALDRKGTGSGRSLYVGAAVAELPPILFETIIAGRKVFWFNLPGEEADELNRALGVVASELGIRLPRVRTEGDFPPGPYDHLWFASILTDPEHYPALHDHLYERKGTDLATGRGDLGLDRRNAVRLVRRATEALEEPAVVVTSDEEVPFLAEALASRGLNLEVPERGRTSPVVGDVLRVCQVEAGS